MPSSMIDASGEVTAKPSVHDLTFGLARSREELSQSFRLVFQSYLKAGLAVEKPSNLRLTPHHLMPTSEVFLAKLGDTVTSTISMFGDGYLGLPMQSMYPQQIRELREDGLRLAEIGCLADRRDTPVRFMDTFTEMSRLVVQVARARGIDALVVATHPKHARLYRRVMGYRQIGDLLDCPYANGNPAVALILKFDEHLETPLHDRYFENPRSSEELLQYRWDRETREYFRCVLERDNKIASLAGIQGYYQWAAITGQLTQ